MAKSTPGVGGGLMPQTGGGGTAPLPKRPITTEEEEEEEVVVTPPAPTTGSEAIYPLVVPYTTSSGSSSVTPGSPHALEWARKQAEAVELQKQQLIGGGEEYPTRREGDVVVTAEGPPQPKEDIAKRKLELIEKRALDIEDKANLLEQQAEHLRSAPGAGTKETADYEDRAAKMDIYSEKLRNKATAIRRKAELGVLKEKGVLGQQLTGIKKKEWKYEKEIGFLGEEMLQLTAESAEEKKRLLAYNNSLADINKKIADTKIDPNRYLKNMPWFGKILGVLGAMAGGYMEGYTGGRIKNRAFDLMKTAIDRDMAAQKSELEKLMNQRNYTATEKAFVYNKWRALEKDKRIAALRKSQMVLAKVGLESERADVKKTAANEIFKADKYINDVILEGKEKARKKVRKSYSSTRGTRLLTPKFAPATTTVPESEGKTMGAEDKKKFAAAFNVPKIFDRVMNVAKKFEIAGRWQGGLKSWLGRGELRAELANQTQDIVQKVREMSGVAARPDEYVKLNRGFSTTFRTKAGAITVIRGFASRAVADLRSRAEYHRAMGQPNVASKYNDFANRIIRRVNKEIGFWNYKRFGGGEGGSEHVAKVKEPAGTKGQK